MIDLARPCPFNLLKVDKEVKEYFRNNNLCKLKKILQKKIIELNLQPKGH